MIDCIIEFSWVSLLILLPTATQYELYIRVSFIGISTRDVLSEQNINLYLAVDSVMYVSLSGDSDGRKSELISSISRNSCLRRIPRINVY